MLDPRGVDPRYIHEIRGRQFAWSPLWGLALALGVVAALMLVFVPVTESDGSATLDCGSAFFGTGEGQVEREDGSVTPVMLEEHVEEGPCTPLRGDRRMKGLLVGLVAALPWWLGRRQLRYLEVRGAHVGALTWVAVSFLLLAWPHTSSQGTPCGSPLSVDVDDDNADAESCVVERPARLAWALLWGLAAIPFTVSASLEQGNP